MEVVSLTTYHYRRLDEFQGHEYLGTEFLDRNVKIAVCKHADIMKKANLIKWKDEKELFSIHNLSVVSIFSELLSFILFVSQILLLTTLPSQ